MSAEPSMGGSKSAGRGLTAEDNELLQSMEFLHSQVTQKMPFVDNAMQEVKALRLQMPNMVNEIDTLKEQLQKLADGLEGGAAAAPSLGSLRNKPASIETQSDGEALGSPSSSLEAVASRVGLIEKELLQLRSGAPAAATPAGTSPARAGSITAEPGAKNWERAIVLIEDRLKSLDRDYRVHVKKVDTRLEWFAAYEARQNDLDLKHNKARDLQKLINTPLKVDHHERPTIALGTI